MPQVETGHSSAAHIKISLQTILSPPMVEVTELVRLCVNLFGSVTLELKFNSVCNQGAFVVSLSYSVNSFLLMWFLKVGMGCVLPVARMGPSNKGNLPILEEANSQSIRNQILITQGH